MVREVSASLVAKIVSNATNISLAQKISIKTCWVALIVETANANIPQYRIEAEMPSALIIVCPFQSENVMSPNALATFSKIFLNNFSIYIISLNATCI